MTNPTKREIERRIEEFEDYDAGSDLDVVIRRDLVMPRKKAEAEGREILGPSTTGGNSDADLVVVERNTTRVAVDEAGR